MGAGALLGIPAIGMQLRHHTSFDLCSTTDVGQGEVQDQSALELCPCSANCANQFSKPGLDVTMSIKFGNAHQSIRLRFVLVAKSVLDYLPALAKNLWEGES